MTGCHEEAQWLQKHVPEKSSIGQFSFAPATQTTVVTTTTTTTTSFPPFVMRAPRHLAKRDPDVYPLAAGPTPPALKKLKFELGGQIAQFEEAEDADRALQQYTKEQSALKANNGVFKSVRAPSIAKDSCISTAMRAPPKASSRASSSARRRFKELESIRKQSATPISLSDDSDMSNANDGEHDDCQVQGDHVPSQTKHHKHKAQLQDAPNLKTKQILSKHDFDKSPSLHYRRSRTQSPHTDMNRRFAGSSTTPGQSSDEDSAAEELSALVRQRPSGLGIDTTAAQDASLPSPSLSPITAAAQLSRRVTASRLRDDSSNESTSYFEHDVRASDLKGSQAAGSSASSLDEHLQSQRIRERDQDDVHLQTSAPRDIPTLLDTFDVMPEKLQSYVMYQLLRRCSKDTLHLVSEAIAPTLKIDFFKRLPFELSQQVLRYLDVQSLCRAARVSKKWREVVDSDEKAWMDLIEVDGFKLPSDEVDRAVREGWGWQFPRYDGEWEVDLSRSKRAMSRSARKQEKAHSRHSRDTHDAQTSSLKRKRNESAVLMPITKRQKQRPAPEGDPLEELTNVPSLVDLGKAHGPNALAGLASLAVPDPKIGIRSLRRMSLFKSLYRRHHLLKRSWLKPKTKPKHIAFRAHEGHVVTCLQFDSDKVLTGSDDAVIDIYDTATGAQRKRLEGHEGGVWALEYQDNILVSGSTDRSVRIWDMDTGECLHVFQGHTSTVRCLQIVQPVKVGTRSDGRPIMMPPGRLIITGSRDSTCRIWKLPKIGDRSVMEAGPTAPIADNPYFVRALAGHTHSVRAIAAHGDTLVSGSYDSSVRVWSISSGETVHRLQGHTTKVYSVVLDHQRKRCISGSMDTVVKVWSLDSGECLFNLNGHNSLVGLLDLKDDVLVSAAADSTLKIWDPERGKIRHTLRAHTGAITCFAHDGQKVISGSERTLKMWNTKTGKCIRDLLTDLRGVWQVRFDERRCIAAVHRGDWTYIEVLDFGAAGDGVPERDRGRRIVVDADGVEMTGRAVHEPNDTDETGEGHHHVVEIED